MATITEDYVSFETAKLLKEKGFNEPCWFWYSPIGELNRHYSEPAKSSPCYETACPTLQMAIKWLMKKHNICIVSLPVVTDDDGDAGCLWNYIISKKLEVLHKSGCLYESPEIALNGAIKYCLEELIMQ